MAAAEEGLGGVGESPLDRYPRRMTKSPHPPIRAPSPIGWERDGVRDFRTLSLARLAPKLSDAFASTKAKAVEVLGIGQGQGQSVGSVRRRQLRQAQDPLNHLGHGYFLSRAVTHHRLLDLTRSNLVNLQTCLGDGGEAGPAGFAH